MPSTSDPSYRLARLRSQTKSRRMPDYGKLEIFCVCVSRAVASQRRYGGRMLDEEPVYGSNHLGVRLSNSRPTQIVQAHNAQLIHEDAQINYMQQPSNRRRQTARAADTSLLVSHLPID
ncbi:unnamed protein product [Strongylus vulgaris]|uniref:Uncharacterized protein n=1 Tax=Strongylus vulgaris TaxID=40348 RepID=A0A3P7IJ85_STRVU|nr:unnamed protein product [Strongylus vulgaris]